MARMDHSRCTHPKTTAARTACRKAGGPGASGPLLPPVDYIGQHIRNEVAKAKVQAPLRNAPRAPRKVREVTDDPCTCGDGLGTIRIHAEGCPAKVRALAEADAEIARIEALPPVKRSGRARAEFPRQFKKNARKPSDPFASCVQAELHQGGGKCACGWTGDN